MAVESKTIAKGARGFNSRFGLEYKVTLPSLIACLIELDTATVQEGFIDSGCRIFH